MYTMPQRLPVTRFKQHFIWRTYGSFPTLWYSFWDQGGNISCNICPPLKILANDLVLDKRGL